MSIFNAIRIFSRSFFFSIGGVKILRKINYNNDFIISGAYSVVKKWGFNSLTARAVAKELAISTQPIYRQFKNMETLKESTIERIFLHVKESFFYENSNLESFYQSYFEFVEKEKELFKAIYSDKEVATKFSQYLYRLYSSSINDDCTTEKSTTKINYCIVEGTAISLVLFEQSPIDSHTLVNYFKSLKLF